MSSAMIYKATAATALTSGSWKQHWPDANFLSKCAFASKWTAHSTKYRIPLYITHLWYHTWSIHNNMAFVRHAEYLKKITYFVEHRFWIVERGDRATERARHYITFYCLHYYTITLVFECRHLTGYNTLHMYIYIKSCWVLLWRNFVCLIFLLDHCIFIIKIYTCKCIQETSVLWRHISLHLFKKATQK